MSNRDLAGRLDLGLNVHFRLAENAVQKLFDCPGFAAIGRLFQLLGDGRQVFVFDGGRLGRSPLLFRFAAHLPGVENRLLDRMR